MEMISNPTVIPEETMHKTVRDFSYVSPQHAHPHDNVIIEFKLDNFVRPEWLTGIVRTAAETVQASIQRCENVSIDGNIHHTCNEFKNKFKEWHEAQLRLNANITLFYVNVCIAIDRTRKNFNMVDYKVVIFFEGHTKK